MGFLNILTSICAGEGIDHQRPFHFGSDPAIPEFSGYLPTFSH